MPPDFCSSMSIQHFTPRITQNGYFFVTRVVLYIPHVLLVSISATFYKQLFCTKAFCAAFLYLQFVFVIFWQKEIGAKAACKVLVKLTSFCTHTFSCFLILFRTSASTLDFLLKSVYHSLETGFKPNFLNGFFYLFLTSVPVNHMSRQKTSNSDH